MSMVDVLILFVASAAGRDRHSEFFALFQNIACEYFVHILGGGVAAEITNPSIVLR